MAELKEGGSLFRKLSQGGEPPPSPSSQTESSIKEDYNVDYNYFSKYRSHTIWVTRQSIFDVCLCNTFFKQQQSKALGSELQPQADYRIWRPLVGLGGVGANVVPFYRGTSLVQYNISAVTSLQLHSFQLLIFFKKIYFKANC